MVSSSVALSLVAVTVVAVTVIGLRYSRGEVGSVEEFITARDSIGTRTMVATLLASNLGGWILFSPAEAGAAFGGITAIAGYALGSAGASLVYVLVGPRIRRLIPRGHTLTEYAYVRYGPAMYAYILLISLCFMFISLAANMTGIVGVLSLVAGVPAWQTAGLVGTFVLVYTAYGGLKASIFTDTVQLVVVLPLLGLVFAVTLLSLGGPRTIGSTVAASDPSLLDPGFVPGLLFGVYIVVAIAGAELLNQAWWQRVYAAQDERTVRRSFAVSGLAVVPIVAVAGLFGVAAAGYGLVEGPGDASVALFRLVLETLPEWVGLVVVLLAVLLVMSTADTLFNAIASVVTADLPRLLDDPSERSLTFAARVTTVAVALGATVIGARAYSVLALFLTADLFAVAAAVPLVYGLYSMRATERGMLAASVSGLVVGMAFLPTVHGPLSALPVLGGLVPAPSFLWAFLGAAAVSAGLAVLSARLTDAGFDPNRLSREIGLLGAGPTETHLSERDD
ncbi:sodium:solute symporter family transporter [Halalkalicoccus ordinarius]|uniref:sodium:solute symporter family transporter n=1 Tax=Halalkalicoccus ordinarius TaxID=3116651 RepID=UPI0039081A87